MSTNYYNYNDPLRIIWRDGSGSNPFSDRIEDHKVINNIITLQEIPDEFSRVKISGYIEGYTTDKSKLQTNEFVVDYTNGRITFSDSAEGRGVNAKYKGRGIILYPASRIYVNKKGHPDVEWNLQQIIDTHEIIFNTLDEYLKFKSEAEQALRQIGIVISDADKNAKYAKEQGDYAKAEGQKSNQSTKESIAQTELAKLATQEANVTIIESKANAQLAKDNAEYAKQQGDLAKLAAQDVGTAINNANDAAQNTINAITDAKDATDAATQATQDASTAAAKAISSAKKADDAAINANKATQEANVVIADTKSATDNAVKATTDAITATNDALAATDESRITTGESIKQTAYAKEQGDYAKVQGDLAKTNGTYAKEQGDYAKGQGDAANTALITISESEKQRVEKENKREANEQNRESAEVERVKNEASREKNEAIRQKQEEDREKESKDTVAKLNAYTYDPDPWVNSKSYYVNNQVTMNGTTYICIKDSLGNVPTDTAYWRVFAQRGADGSGTVATITSSNGDILVSGTPQIPDLSINMTKIDSAIKESEKKVEQVRSDLEIHTTNKSNPHEITADQIGAAKNVDLENHINNKDLHISKDLIDTLNAKETMQGAQEKANLAEQNAKDASIPRTGGTVSGDLEVSNNLTVKGRNVIDEIDSLKQLGVDNKQLIVDAVNAATYKNVSTTDPWKGLANQIKNGMCEVDRHYNTRGQTAGSEYAYLSYRYAIDPFLVVFRYKRDDGLESACFALKVGTDYIRSYTNQSDVEFGEIFFGQIVLKANVNLTEVEAFAYRAKKYQ
ncbi:hypothetical protein M5X17_27555 [Paenibacillus alvei]|uniref:hypothetical protein n=1 Tax=Paenibacillus alvei TaxID=44250 RepID=UPI00227E7FA0|nr:hypothetical protein [Paenibacillus alvei]MCY9737462.1 hypothetical protein [Paenibacillus alvei]